MPVTGKCMSRTIPFTLLEIVAAMAIFSILGIILYQILHGSERLLMRTQRNLEVMRNARTAFRIIERDLAGLKTSSAQNERILVDAAGVGSRTTAFVTGSAATPGAFSSVQEVGYELLATNLIRWSTTDEDGTKWNFLDNDPAIWAADTSWGTARTIVGGVRGFDIAFFWADPDPPYYAAYDAVTDSDVAPDFAMVTLTLVHPRTLDNAVEVQNMTRHTFNSRVQIGND